MAELNVTGYELNDTHFKDSENSKKLRNFILLAFMIREPQYTTGSSVN